MAAVPQRCHELPVLGRVRPRDSPSAAGNTIDAVAEGRRRPTSYALATDTLTFLFTDIEGSTNLLQGLGHEAYASVLAEHHSLIRSALVAHAGKEVSTQGERVLVVFSSPSVCVSAAIESQRALSSHCWPSAEPVRVRMGIHAGEAEEAATGLVGLEVHRAAAWRPSPTGDKSSSRRLQPASSRTSPTRCLPARPRSPPFEGSGTARADIQLQAAGLQSEFPPLRSLDNPALANNLAAQPATFVGRERGLSELRRLVEDSRLVTLTGAGGAGKTRLAVQLAAECLDGSGDGVWLVELASVSNEAAVASTILDVLGMATRSGQSPLEILVTGLASQRALIVLDNCEHLVGACAKVADAILRRCPEISLLATSREPLGIAGEILYRVPSMSLPDEDNDPGEVDPRSGAIALFAERATAQGVGFVLDRASTPLVTEICRRLDGMPLAIELAASRLRALSLADLNDRLDQRFRLLTGGSRNALARQQTLLATVDWSYSLLTAPSRSCFGACRCSSMGSNSTPRRRSALAATSTCSRSPTSWRLWSTRTSSWRNPPTVGFATGCWRRSDSSQLSG